MFTEISVSCTVSNFHSEFAHCPLFVVFQTVSLYFCAHAFIYHVRPIQFV